MELAFSSVIPLWANGASSGPSLCSGTDRERSKASRLPSRSILCAAPHIRQKAASAGQVHFVKSAFFFFFLHFFFSLGNVEWHFFQFQFAKLTAHRHRSRKTYLRVSVLDKVNDRVDRLLSNAFHAIYVSWLKTELRPIRWFGIDRLPAGPLIGADIWHFDTRRHWPVKKQAWELPPLLVDVWTQINAKLDWLQKLQGTILTYRWTF